MARRSDHSREQIQQMALDAARDIVARDGYTGLSARKVAKTIGYTVGTLYLVFANLDELVMRANAQTLDALYEVMLATKARCKNARACIMALGQAYIRFASENTHLWGMIYEHPLPDRDAIPDWYRERVARNLALVEDTLQPLAKNTSAQQLAVAARALWGGVHGICILALTNKLDVVGAASVPALVESLIDNYLKGLTANRQR